MTPKPKIEDAVREAIISQPDAILDDKDLIHALIAANEKIMGANIVDLRGIAMDRLETRLDRLEDTHRSVIAAAYENLNGTNQIHRAILRLMECEDLETLLDNLNGDIAETLRVGTIRLVLEMYQSEDDCVAAKGKTALCLRPEGYVEAYLTRGRPGVGRQVTLRQVPEGDDELFGEQASWVRSEACLKLNFGEGRRPGLLVLGAEDPNMFNPQQGGDLLIFFAGVFEKLLRRWLP
ncbi:MAG: DUF484 family protein [Roseobacter sp.]